MIFVLDASVAIAAARPAEVAHLRARSMVDRILRGDDAIVVPSLFGIEVVAGLTRRGHDAAGAEAFVDALLAPPSETITLGPVRAAMIRRTAAASRLRAADACRRQAGPSQLEPLEQQAGKQIAKAAPAGHSQSERQSCDWAASHCCRVMAAGGAAAPRGVFNPVIF